MTDLREQLKEATGRLTMAKAFAKLLMKAFDALLHHGVNYKSLPEWQAYTDHLDEIAKLPFHRGVQEHISLMGRIGNAIDAAVRRKGFHVVPAPQEPDDE